MPKKKSHVANDTLFGQGHKLFRGKKSRKNSGMFKKGSARKKGGSTASGNADTITGSVTGVIPADKQVKVKYTVDDEQKASHANCRVGGLAPDQHSGLHQPVY